MNERNCPVCGEDYEGLFAEHIALDAVRLTARVAELEETNTVLMTRNSELFNRCVEKQKELASAKEEMDSWFRKCGLAELELVAAKAEIERLKSKTVFVPMHERGTDDGQ